MTITVKEIRERFPNPRDSREADVSVYRDYCVGGALCKFLKGGGNENWSNSFPDFFAIVHALRIAQPHLTREGACEFARVIIKANDSGDFEAAWKALEEALNYGGMTERISEAMSLVCAAALRRGLRNAKDFPGCAEMEIGRFWFAINGHATTTKCSQDVDVLPYNCYVMVDGWPAGMFDAFGGSLIGADTERILVETLKEDALSYKTEVR